MLQKKIYNYLCYHINVLREQFIDFWYYSNRKYTSNTLLIIKTDAIGDYIIFRNFLAEIKSSDKYKNFRIILCGNELWKDIALTFDSAYVDQFVWIDPQRLINKEYKRNVEIELYDLKAEIVIYPSYSRTQESDGLVIRSGAKKKIGFLGDNRNMLADRKLMNDRRYSQLIPVKNNTSFEFDRYVDFFSFFLSSKIKLQSPFLKQKNIQENKIVFCPGSSSGLRRWSIESFHKIAVLLKENNMDFKINICGNIKEAYLAQSFSRILPNIEFYDYTKTLNLVEFIDFVSDAKLVVTNDSGPLHIAAACNVNVVCISNGNNFGRFLPYPIKINHKVKTVFPELLYGLENDSKKVSYYQNTDSKIDINSVTVEQVLLCIRSILSENYVN